MTARERGATRCLPVSEANKVWRPSMAHKPFLAFTGDMRTGYLSALLLMLCLGGSAWAQSASKVPHVGWLDFWPQCDFVRVG